MIVTIFITLRSFYTKLVFFFLSCLISSVAEETNSTSLSELELAKRDAKDFKNLATLIKPSVVVIESVDRNGYEGGRGTGFVVREDGVIATNFHVIGEHRDFSVRLSDGRTFRPHSILAIDRDRDLALIKIEAKKLPVLQLGNSQDLIPGQAVLSIGNPLGYEHSVSRGVIAAIRELEFGDGRPMVQVAIPIEPGSSGSPALDLNGNVIAILSIKSGGAMGFGVPVNELKKLLGDLAPIPIKNWLTIGALDELEWKAMMNGSWKQRAGIISAVGLGNGFGGRMLCLNQTKFPKLPYEIEVEVKLENESGAAGLVFHSDGKDRHYGFYPTNGSLRLTRFEGPNVFSWTILQTIPSEAYRLNEWNRLRVRLEENGRMICSVNDEVVIDLVDRGLESGQVGLCKFREPTARFRFFRVSKRFPKSKVTPAFTNQVRKLVRPLLHRDSLETSEIDELVNMGNPTPQALRDHAMDLEKKAKEIKRLAGEVRERLVIEELAKSLRIEERGSVDLLRSALLIARLDNENFDLDSYLEKADLLASKIEKSFTKSSSQEEKLLILVKQLFGEMGFHGSTLDYHHRSNSYMNEVIDDREGLPITLSILLIELANRLDLPVSGLGLPGHFMAIYKEDPPGEKSGKRKSRELLIDSFGGKIVSREEASRITGVTLEEEDFEPVSNRDIITRMLRNLIQSAEREEDSVARLRYVDAIIAIDPNDRYTRAMRAMIHYGEGRFTDALIDIDFLIEKNPDAPELEPLKVLRGRLIEQGASAP
jgi:regulator of sirC expression with transglutaminase-like and TPR domain